MDLENKDRHIGALRNALIVARMVLDRKGCLEARVGENAPTVGTIIDRAMKQTERKMN